MAIFAQFNNISIHFNKKKKKLIKIFLNHLYVEICAYGNQLKLIKIITVYIKQRANKFPTIFPPATIRKV